MFYAFIYAIFMSPIYERLTEDAHRYSPYIKTIHYTDGDLSALTYTVLYLTVQLVTFAQVNSCWKYTVWLRAHSILDLNQEPILSHLLCCAHQND